MKLSVIIVSYNVKFYVEQCLHSLYKAIDGIDAEVFVVDNHSKDDTVRYIRRRFKKVKLIDLNNNLGFARANNIAINQARGEYILLLNPDTFVGEKTICGTLDFMDSHQKAGGIGVCMYNSDGTVAMESRRGLPSPLTAFYKMCGLCSRYPRSKRFGKYYMSYLPWDTSQCIEVVSGAYFMLRRKAVDEVGMLDEDFFMYGEDIDLSYRLLKGGWENWYLPLPILHYKGESTHKSSFSYVHVFYRAMLIFFRKHYAHISICLSLPITLAIYMSAFMALMKIQTNKVRKLLGFVDRRNCPDRRYVFIGSKNMIERCHQMVSRKGIVADFVHYGHDKLELPSFDDLKTNEKVYVVFDTDLFGFEEIIDKLHGFSHKNIFVGTYFSKTGIVITPNDILR
ncbi:glycosyltransferase family 2 protein [Xylanibacter muris]|uniref:Glycosyltransferase family 2 protein n=1 Tax=Xylanibacter muris TaxID=2736290 RepID=A0ABX2AK35_9BACT|nr:glycosyltransferase family 2 protein [Xylanibacter muris]NPD91523.1 glycosyltransferase family 2 protein [Xylanibacter muris]